MPWLRRDNPFEGPEEPKHPATMVEVKCKGCTSRNVSTMINLRVEKKDAGHKRRNCRNCNITTIDVYVDAKGGVEVYQTVGNSSPEKTTYEKIWQEGDKA